MLLELLDQKLIEFITAGLSLVPHLLFLLNSVCKPQELLGECAALALLTDTAVVKCLELPFLKGAKLFLANELLGLMDLFVGEHREREVGVNWLLYDCVAARAAVFLSVARRRSFLVGGGLAEGV